MPRLKISVNERKRPVIEYDGNKINGLHAFHLVAEANSVTRLIMECSVTDIEADIDALAEIIAVKQSRLHRRKTWWQRLCGDR